MESQVCQIIRHSLELETEWSEYKVQHINDSVYLYRGVVMLNVDIPGDLTWQIMGWCHLSGRSKVWFSDRWTQCK